MKILIKITKDIQQKAMLCPRPGTEECKTSCVVALAIRDLFPNAIVYTQVSNLLGGVYGPGGKAFDQIDHSEEMKHYIRTFDGASHYERINMPEATFEIKVPEYVLNEIGISSAYRVLSESKTLELISI